jgi:hypothetical protein
MPHQPVDWPKSQQYSTGFDLAVLRFNCLRMLGILEIETATSTC